LTKAGPTPILDIGYRPADHDHIGRCTSEPVALASRKRSWTWEHRSAISLR